MTFDAPRFLRNAHVQTLGAALPLWTWGEGDAEDVRIPLPSGGTLHGRASWQRGEARAVVVTHGVGGSSRSNYVRRAAVALHRAGYHVVRLDLRGAGDSIPDSTQLYHAGLIEDPREALAAIAARDNVRDVSLLGFSLGGNVALKLAGAWKGDVPKAVRAVVSISAPLDLVETSRALERLRTLPYRRYVLRALVRQGAEFARVHPSRAAYDATKLAGLKTIRAYDELVVAPMHDFSDAHDYYVNASSGSGLADIEVPTLILHAEDDPMIPAATVRPWLADASRAVRISWSERGGHVGWFAGLDERSWLQTWALDRAIEFIANPG